jgi:hypothetical protein
MRSFRLVVLSLAAIAAAGLTPSVGAAQETRGFADSWYWGAYGSAIDFATSTSRITRPSVGAEWMLTRTKFALNIFADQSYFTTGSSVANPTGAGLGTSLPASISDMRRIGFAVMLFLPDYGAFKPYFGLGYSFNLINSATLTVANPGGTPAAQDSVSQAVNDARSMGKVLGNVGVMYVYKRFAPFAQFTLMPTTGAGDWYLNGPGMTKILSVGLRYNFGTSIDKW